MKRYRFILCLVFIAAASYSFGQVNKQGNPLITNFKPLEFDFADQNWAAVQDPRGIMYFGNGDGYILEYDSKTWRKINVKDSKTIRSMAIDSLGTIYVGTIGDFGRLVPNVKGELVFESLSKLVNDSTIVYNDIFKTIYLGGNVIFQSLHYIFIYNGKTVKTISIDRALKPFLLLQANDKVFLGTRATGISKLTDSSLVHVEGSEQFKLKSIFNIIPLKNSNDLLIISDAGFYSFNLETGKLTASSPNKSFISGILAEGGMPYHNIALNDSTLGLGFIYSDDYSFTRINENWSPLEVINKRIGLQNEFVTYLYQKPSISGSSPLWLCLNIGIARADIHSPLRKFGEESGIKGQIQAITRFNGRLYIATMAGLYYLDFDKKGFPFFQQVNNIPTSLSFTLFIDKTTKRERLIVCSNPGLYEITSDFKVQQIDNSLFTNKAYQSKSDPSTLFVGSVAGVWSFKWDGTKWSTKRRLKNDLIKSGIRYIQEGKKGDVWLATFVHGIQRIRTTGKDTIVDMFTTEHGLPSLKDISLFEMDEKLLFATENGFYQFNHEKELFEHYTINGLPQEYANKGIFRVEKTQDGLVFVFIENKKFSVVQFTRNSDSTLSVTNRAFRVLPTHTFDALYVEPEGTIWSGISTELYSYNSNTTRNYSETFNTLIRKVITKGDSVVFNGAYYRELENGNRVLSSVQNPLQVYTFPYSLNSFTFEVAAPFYEAEHLTEYSFILEGYDNQWSKWSNKPQPIYTNLSEGKYIFKAKARNIFGTEGSIAEYRFSVNPPWYRSIFALILYVVLLLAFIWFVVKWNTRRLIAEKERLEELVRQRTAEVVAQKEEIELQNEELEHQRDKIFEQNEEIKSSITYASRIQNALMPPMETIQSIFDDIFILFLPRDIVSGDFYWITQFGNRKICAAADCTGHGVPGGFMSMLGMGLLNQIISRNEKITASELLDQLRTLIITSLHQTGKSGESKDGMDISLFIVDTEKQQIEFAGANNPLILIRNNELIQYKGDKMPIGIHLRCDIPFTNNVMEYFPGDIIYTFSDGYQDQFGGPDQRKFMIKNLKELLFDIHKKPMQEQHDILHKALHDWHGASPRIDDVVLIGVRL